MKNKIFKLHCIIIMGLFLSANLSAKDTFYSRNIKRRMHTLSAQDPFAVKKKKNMSIKTNPFKSESVKGRALNVKNTEQHIIQLPNGSISGQVYEKSYSGVECYSNSSNYSAKNNVLIVPRMGGRVGDTLTVPIRAQKINEPVSAFELTINLGDVLAFDTLVTSSLIGDAGWTIYSHCVDHQIHIAAAGATPIKSRESNYDDYDYHVPGSDTLFCIRVIILDTDFQFVPITLSNAILDTGAVEQELIDGGIYASPDTVVIIPLQDFVDVEVWNEYGTFVKGEFVSVLDTGIYTISDIPAGKYYISIYSFSYKPSYYKNVQDWQQATLVSVNPDQNSSNIDFLLEYAISKGRGCIAGTVLGSDGHGVNNCQVITYSDELSITAMSETDETGCYLISGLATGSYLIRLEYDGEENYLDSWYDNKESYKTATPVSVTDPDTTKGIDFNLQPGGSIIGLVLDASGNPIGKNCNVMVYSSDYDYENGTYTDSDGKFTLNGLPTGKYRVAASYYGYPDIWYDGIFSFDEATDIEVVAGEVKYIIFQFKQGSSIAGTVYAPDGTPVESAYGMIYLYDMDENIVTELQTQDDGKFEISGLPAGQYKLFFASWYCMIPGPASGWYDHAADFETAKIIVTRGGQVTRNINMTLDWGGLIQGSVSTPAGLLPDECGYVVAFNENEDVVNYSEVYLGFYSICALRSGHYKLKFFYNGDDNFVDIWYKDAMDFDECEAVTVISSRITSGIEFKLTYGCIVQGFVTDGSGCRLSGDLYPDLSLYLIDADSKKYVEQDEISFNGGYQFRVRPGNYSLLCANHYSNLWGTTAQDSLASTFYPNGACFSDSKTKIIAAKSNDILRLDDLVMDRVSSGIFGTLYDKQGGIPVADPLYGVVCFDQSGMMVKMIILAGYSGEYSALGLRPGIYYLIAFKGSNLLPDITAQWYNGIPFDLRNASGESLWLEIPEQAEPVTVNENQYTKIDFIFAETGIENNGGQSIPGSFCLRQNYPNPFNPQTTVQYEIPQKVFVDIQVFNVLGQRITSLVHREQEAGIYRIQWDGSGYPSGIYFYRIESGDFSAIRRCLLLK